MKMKLCPFCAEPIQAAAVICKHCQRDVPAPELAPVTPSTSRKNMIAIWGILALVVVTLAVYSASTGSLTAPVEEDTRAQETEDAAKRTLVIDQARRAGIIHSLTCDSREAQVPLGAWLALDADTKRNMTITLASHCGGRMTVIDAQSGRELASFRAGRYSVK